MTTTEARPVVTSTGTTQHTVSPSAGRKGNVIVEWITTTDHKKIGYMYLISSFIYFCLGGVMALIILLGVIILGLAMWAMMHGSRREKIRRWLLDQQYHERHLYTDAPPGGWAWTDLPGGVPDADDTSGALLALHDLHQPGAILDSRVRLAFCRPRARARAGGRCG